MDHCRGPVFSPWSGLSSLILTLSDEVGVLTILPILREFEVELQLNQLPNVTQLLSIYFSISHPIKNLESGRFLERNN